MGMGYGSWGMGMWDLGYVLRVTGYRLGRQVQ